MSAADELRRLIADAESLNGSALYMDKYLKLHYRDFLALIDAAEVFTSDDGLCLDRVIANANALRLALKPFTEGAK